MLMDVSMGTFEDGVGLEGEVCAAEEAGLCLATFIAAAGLQGVLSQHSLTFTFHMNTWVDVFPMPK